jgi:5-(carboxyamino)imidazole ribonucleotide synthase
MLSLFDMRIGILGGGQLGRMLLQAAANYPVETYILENNAACPSAHLCHHFVLGDIKSFDDVYNFGKGLDAITIEIESVNVDALEKLEAEGIKVYPSAKVIRTIKNKVLQKGFYLKNDIPSPEFVVTHSAEEVKKWITFLPAVHKVGEGGYDGRGVELIHTIEDFGKAFNASSVLEKMVDIKTELAIIVAANAAGDTAIYPSAEMVVNQKLNLLNYQISPSFLPKEILWKAEAIALKVVKFLASPGIFAVELFVDQKNNVWVNETAPRVHNSGHHTIEGNFCSQFDMLWRIMLNYPLGSTNPILNAAMINVVGSENHIGEAVYEGLDDILKIENCFVHVYGKKETRPGRKMGHVTILSNEKQELIHQVNRIKQMLKVVSK